MPAEPFITYRRADGQPIDDYDFVTDEEWFTEGDGEPTKVIRETWTLASTETIWLPWPTCAVCGDELVMDDSYDGSALPCRDDRCVKTFAEETA